MLRRLTMVAVLFTLAVTAAGARADGFAQLKVVDRRGSPVSGASVRLEGGRVTYSNITGPAGVVQWSSSRVPAGRYIVRVSKGRRYVSAGLAVRYREGRWAFFRIMLP